MLNLEILWDFIDDFHGILWRILYKWKFLAGKLAYKWWNFPCFHGELIGISSKFRVLQTGLLSFFHQYYLSLPFEGIPNFQTQPSIKRDSIGFN